MGTKVDPSYANAFDDFMQKQIFWQYTHPILDYFCQYIDDCIGTTSCSRVEPPHTPITSVISERSVRSVYTS